MSKSSSKESPSSEAQMGKSTTMIAQDRSPLVGSTEMAVNSVLQPTGGSGSNLPSSPGAAASSHASAEKSSQKRKLKSRVSPEKLLEELEKPSPHVLHVKKEDLEQFIQMMSEVDELIRSKI